jgi:predicted secreted hydrolase
MRNVLRQLFYFLSAAAVLPTLLLILFPRMLHNAHAAPPRLAQVQAGRTLHFPADFGAHPDYRTEWWYITGWISTPQKKPIGFQVTFFRSATDHDNANPSQFAPKQVIIGHAALSDPAHGKLLYAQKSAREGFNLAYAKVGNTDIKLDDWHLTRNQDGSYQTRVSTPDFTLTLQLTSALPPGQALQLQGDQGFSRKGPMPEQASYYYSAPQLRVAGSLRRNSKTSAVSGHAWLDHEWSSQLLNNNASGWDWVAANLDDGGTLMAFQVRSKTGDKLWAHAVLRDASGKMTQYAPEQVRFLPQRRWRSPRTGINYPINCNIELKETPHRTNQKSTMWHISPLQDDQEFDARNSVGNVYWEGAVKIMRNNKTIGQGYMELTGYDTPLKL